MHKSMCIITYSSSIFAPFSLTALNLHLRWCYITILVYCLHSVKHKCKWYLIPPPVRHTCMHLIHLHRKYKYQHVHLYRALRLHLNFKSAVKQSCYAINWCNQVNASSVTTLTKALAQIGLFVNENFGGDHISKRHEHLQKILVPTLLGQVIDEQVGALWPYSIW